MGNIGVILMVIALVTVVLAVAFAALYALNKDVDQAPNP
jgi:hypothetical protein